MATPGRSSAPTSCLSNPLPRSEDAIIIDAVLGVGHDGAAEAVIMIRYPNGAIRPVTFTSDALGQALEAHGISSLNELRNQPWTILVPNAHVDDNGKT